MGGGLIPVFVGQGLLLGQLFLPAEYTAPHPGQRGVPEALDSPAKWRPQSPQRKHIRVPGRDGQS